MVLAVYGRTLLLINKVDLATLPKWLYQRCPRASPTLVNIRMAGNHQAAPDVFVVVVTGNYGTGDALVCSRGDDAEPSQLDRFQRVGYRQEAELSILAATPKLQRKKCAEGMMDC